MIGPRHMGSSPTLKRQLSRLSSSSSFQVRQSNSRIYTFLIAGGLILLATVGLLQFNLQGAPRSSKLSPRETGQSGGGTVPEGLGRDQGALDKSKVADSVDEDGDEEGMYDVGFEMDDDEDGEVDEEALFDLDVDDRMAEEEAEDEDPEVLNGEDHSATKYSTGVGLDVKNVTKNDSSSSVLTTDHHEVVKTHGEVVEVTAIPDWVLDIKVGGHQEGGVDSLQAFERDLVKGVEKEKRGSFYWDHGIKKRALENVDELVRAGGEEGEGVDIERGAAKVALQHLKGFKEIVESWKERFNSDDELVDENVQQRLEGVREIEDALLLNVGDGAASADKASSSWRKVGAVLKRGPRSGSTFDGVNPTSNPMLQDPDTPPGTWMTRTDKEMLRAIRGDCFGAGQQPKAALLRGNIVTVGDSVVHRQASAR